MTYIYLPFFLSESIGFQLVHLMAVQTKNRFSVLSELPDSGESQVRPTPNNKKTHVQNRNVTNLQGVSIQPDNTKKYFKILQAVHHAEILLDMTNRDTLPQGMLKQVNRLSSSIKPSSPNETVRDLVRQNTMKWMTDNMQILRQHYDSVLASELENIGHFDSATFEKAVSWAKNRYKRKLTASSVETCRGLLLSPAQLSTSERSLNLNSPDFPPLSPAAQLAEANPASSSGHTQANPAADTGPVDLSQIRPHISTHLRDKKQPVRQQRVSTVDVLIHSTDASKSLLTSQLNNAEVSPQAANVTNIAPITTDNTPQVNFNLVLEESFSTHPHQTPLYSNVVVPISDSISPAPSPGEPLGDVGRAMPTSPVGAGAGGDTGRANREAQNVMMEGSPKSLNDGRTPQSEVNPVTAPLCRPQRAPTTRRRSEPTVHPHTSRKLQDWRLKVEKPNIIIGDSNLSRVPVFEDADLQVDSFPGATCLHITTLLRKLSIQPQVERVVLSVGLNNCLREQNTPTAWKQIQQMVKTATSTFPMASIYVPLIHYSERLPQIQQSLIKELNIKIKEKLLHLHRLDRAKYEADPKDPLHWTKETADHILKHWLNQLNM